MGSRIEDMLGINPSRFHNFVSSAVSCVWTALLGRLCEWSLSMHPIWYTGRVSMHVQCRAGLKGLPEVDVLPIFKIVAASGRTRGSYVAPQ